MTNNGSANLSVIDIGTNTVTATVDVGVGPFGVAIFPELNEIVAKVQAGSVRSACNQLRSFINQVQGFIKSGKLTSVEGQPLLDAAEGIRTDLGC